MHLTRNEGSRAHPGPATPYICLHLWILPSKIGGSRPAELINLYPVDAKHTQEGERTHFDDSKCHEGTKKCKVCKCAVQGCIAMREIGFVPSFSTSLFCKSNCSCSHGQTHPPFRGLADTGMSLRPQCFLAAPINALIGGSHHSMRPMEVNQSRKPMRSVHFWT
jgi:hypothetical protein